MVARRSQEAEEDIIELYVAGMIEFGAGRADAYHEGLTHVFGLLAEQPELARERHEISPPVRIHPYGVHIIVYRLLDDGDVMILRVRHGREDWIDDSR